jgi:Mg-chelatase subunit ChlD
MRARRKLETLNLSFLDIMACGLGAVILVFMLIKKEAEQQQAPPVPVEPGLLAADLSQLSEQESALQQELARLRAIVAERSRQIGGASADLRQAEADLAARRREMQADQAKVSELEESIKRIQPAKKEDVIEKPGAGEEQYVIGLRMTGRKILFLVDASASMTDETLIEVIKRKTGTDQEKRRGPKWQRTLSIVRWMAARVPAGSSAAIIAFNEKAQTLGSGWVAETAALNPLLRSLETLVPSGPTNLEAGLREAQKLQPTDIYLITDGLPTAGLSRYQGLNPFASCSSLFGQSATISGECRLRLFRHTVLSNPLPQGTRVNIVLLPIEGDPQAAPEMWAWSSNTGGLLISPAANWP